ncbi:MAG: spermidine/putrescine ABC transporter substrate-binding protein [Caldilineaceae bacterium]
MQRFLLTLGLLLTLVFSACAGAVSPAAPASDSGGSSSAADAAPSDSGRCGDKSKLSKSVSFYNWTDYIDPDVLSQFETECGVDVVYDTYSSNEDLLAKMQAGATGYDLIVPSDYMVSIMIQLNMLHELDHANIPNLSNIYPRFAEAPYDPGNVYTAPYQWGTTGIGYNLEATGEVPDSWDWIFDPEKAVQFKGKMSLLNDQREVIGAALKYLGHSMNSVDPDELEAAKQVILAIKPYVATFDSDSFGQLLVSGDVVIGHGWSGGYFKDIYASNNDNLGYVIPQEGGVIWTDNLAIPATAPNPYTAEVLINYLLDPEIGAMISNYNYYASPNQASEPLLNEEITSDRGIYPSEETLAKMEFLRELGEGTLLWDRIWTEIKSE